MSYREGVVSRSAKIRKFPHIANIPAHFLFHPYPTRYSTRYHSSTLQYKENQQDMAYSK